MCVCVCVYMNMHAHVNTGLSAYTLIYIYTYIHPCMPAYIHYIPACMHTYIYSVAHLSSGLRFGFGHTALKQASGEASKKTKATSSRATQKA